TPRRARRHRRARRGRRRLRRAHPAGGPPGRDPAADASRTPRAPAGVGRPVDPDAVCALPVRALPRSAIDPPGRRGSLGGAGLLMAATPGTRARPKSGEGHAGSIEQLLAAKEIVISCGSGGVGKTTTAAAIAAMAAVRLGGRVLVLTVDPARRLANALGLEGFGNSETRVPDAAFTAAGVQPRGELWAAMLDTKQSWDNLVVRHAPDARTAHR